MKREKQCPKCKSVQIGHIAHQPDLRADSATAKKRVVGLGLGVGGEIVKHGQLEAYVCTRCGYYESYVRDPQRIDWDEIAGFSFINPGQHDEPGPYR